MKEAEIDEEDVLSNEEAVAEIRRLDRTRLHGCYEEVNGGSLWGAVNRFATKAKAKPSRTDRLSKADHDHLRLFERYRKRYAYKLAGSIILKNPVYWELHICRFPVFETSPHPITGKLRFRLRFSNSAREARRWLQGHNIASRRRLCELVREQIAENRRARTRIEGEASDFILPRAARALGSRGESGLEGEASDFILPREHNNRLKGNG